MGIPLGRFAHRSGTAHRAGARLMTTLPGEPPPFPPTPPNRDGHRTSGFRVTLLDRRLARSSKIAVRPDRPGLSRDNLIYVAISTPRGTATSAGPGNTSSAEDFAGRTPALPRCSRTKNRYRPVGRG
ncbi:hypothetical protein DSL92_00485 [Billgrantia gudaonensis]|uniref:Uncharacterized protein n=1 Tax=Billgrantia gudaonensis TaxID=376427 RepID=A0A432JL18_9GAMM|nr:hypothetical protein DSL92_00485 [Halomonas gudaonensis]